MWTCTSFYAEVYRLAGGFQLTIDEFMNTENMIDIGASNNRDDENKIHGRKILSISFAFLATKRQQ